MTHEIVFIQSLTYLGEGHNAMAMYNEAAWLKHMATIAATNSTGNNRHQSITLF